MRRPTLIILCCIGFMLGIFQGYNFIYEISYLWVIFILISIVSAILASNKYKFIPLVLMMFILGVICITSRINFISQNSISDKLFVKSKVEGVVIGDPYWDKDRNYVFTITDLKVDGKSKAESIKVKTFSSAVKEGNLVEVEGKLFPSLAKPGYVMSYAKINIINSTQPFLVQIKNKLYSGADIAIGGEEANFIKGILVGARSSLAQDYQETLNSTGLSHVVAVSGYNLTILVVILQKLLRKKWAWGGLIISLIVVWGFCLLTGGSASILRAAIMASVFLIASYYGRSVSIFVSISLTALITLIINPLAIAEDLGWQLSFLSLTGIVLLSPALQKLLPKKPKLLFEIVSITLAAQIATVPYILYIFGSYSTLAFLANTILMPFIPLLMLIGFIASILGLILPGQSYILGGYISLLIKYIFDFLRYLQFQDAFKVSSPPSLFVIALWYLFILIIGLIVYNKGLVSSFQKHQELVK